MDGEENDFLLYECLEVVGLQQHYSRFSAAGVRSAAHLSGLTMEDYPILGISSMEDRTQLFRLVQMLKSLDLWREAHDSECGSSDSDENYRAVDDGLARLGGDGDARPLSGVGTRLDFSGATFTRHQKLRSEAAPSTQLSSRRAWRRERKGISKKEKPCLEKSRRKTLEQKAASVPVYESRTAGYNYGLPLSSPPAPNKRQLRQQRITVCVRKRPLTHRECRRGEADVVTTLTEACVTVNERKEAVDLSQYMLQHRFYFDHVFGEESTNEEVYERTAYPLVQHMLHRGSATCFAYGQTGAGKTHTMLGSAPGRPGLYALAVRDIFAHLSDSAQTLSPLLVFVSFFEIYCGQLYDLLDGRKRLFAREDGQKVVHIAGLHEVRVDSVGSLLEVVSHGMAERTQGASGVNAHSSRSHAMLQIQLRGPNQQMVGRMWFVDLAGSERASDNKEPGRQSRMEGAEINQSLLALKECIRSLDQAQAHTPFRQSKLTQVLKDSFLGDSMTCMIANISPGHTATEHTLNTLRYADRVKELSGRGRQGGRRGKTMSSKHNSPVNIRCNESGVATRGKSPPKRPKLGGQSHKFVSSSSVASWITDDPVFCSTPKNNGCPRAQVGTGLEGLTPIRGFLEISGQRESSRRNEGRTEKVQGEASNHDQSIRAGTDLGKLHIGNVQKRLEFPDRELENEWGLLNRGTGWKGHDINRDVCPKLERKRETGSQKEKETHLKRYHQQLQKLMPSFDSSPERLLSTSTRQPSSSSRRVPQFSTSPPRHSSQCSAQTSFDLETDSDAFGTKVDFETYKRGHASSFANGGLYIHNQDKSEVSRGALRDTRQDLALLEDRKPKYGKGTGNGEKERTITPTDEGQFILRQDYRGPGRIESGGKRRGAWVTPAGIPQINAVTDARRNDTEPPLFETPTAAYRRSPAEHPLSPTRAPADTLQAPDERFEPSREFSGSACPSHILPPPSRDTHRAKSTSCGAKDAWTVGDSSENLPHDAPNIHNDYGRAAEPINISCSTEDSVYNQFSRNPDTDGKMCILPQGKGSAGFTSDIMDPLSISLLEVDQQVATSSFLQDKKCNLSLFDNGAGADKKNQCGNFAFSVSPSSESVQNALPKWQRGECSAHPVNISVQPHSLSETNIDKGEYEFQISPHVHLCTLGDRYHAQYRVVQAHWDQMEEMETLFRKEGTLLYQQPDMEFGEYIHKLGEIMARKARCVHSMIAQLQPYLKSIHSHQRHNHEAEVIIQLPQ